MVAARASPSAPCRLCRLLHEPGAERKTPSGYCRTTDSGAAESEPRQSPTAQGWRRRQQWPPPLQPAILEPNPAAAQGR
ncbi:hypothetical protein E2320_007264 [Naja naja]|nr:hypothetical protein E2320_007264 [Naja naja]